MARSRPERRRFPEGAVPLLDVAGTALECGERLGHAWRPALERFAQTIWAGSSPWWKEPAHRRLIDRLAPYLPDLFRGMARGAGLSDDQVGSRVLPRERGCTSFAVHPRLTLDGTPISGQTKDTPDDRVYRYVVLRMKVAGGPEALTLTYPGWLFGHGFVAGGCCIWRNSLYAGRSEGRLSYAMWGTLALHCPTADDAADLARRHGVACDGAHCTIADSHGGIVGIEIGARGVRLLRPKRGLYTHANHVASGATLRRFETYDEAERLISEHRQRRLHARLAAERGRLTAQLALQALADHEGYPNSVCRHRPGSSTTAAVVAEPAKGRLHVTRGAPCRHWPTTFSLEGTR